MLLFFASRYCSFLSTQSILVPNQNEILLTFNFLPLKKENLFSSLVHDYLFIFLQCETCCYLFFSYSVRRVCYLFFSYSVRRVHYLLFSYSVRRVQSLSLLTLPF